MIIDRIEGIYAVAETDEGTVNISLSQLPGNVKAGDVVIYENGGFVIDAEKTSELRSAASGRLKRLLNRNND